MSKSRTRLKMQDTLAAISEYAAIAQFLESDHLLERALSTVQRIAAGDVALQVNELGRLRKEEQPCA